MSSKGRRWSRPRLPCPATSVDRCQPAARGAEDARLREVQGGQVRRRRWILLKLWAGDGEADHVERDGCGGFRPYRTRARARRYSLCRTTIYPASLEHGGGDGEARAAGNVSCPGS